MAIQPVYKYKLGAINLTIWKNELEKDGKKFFTYSTTILRTYKKDKDNYAETSSMRVNDLPKVDMLARRAYQWILQQPMEIPKQDPQHEKNYQEEYVG